MLHCFADKRSASRVISGDIGVGIAYAIYPIGGAKLNNEDFLHIIQFSTCPRLCPPGSHLPL